MVTHNKVKGKMPALLAVAFGLVVILICNELIQSAFKQVFGDASRLYITFTYAIIITIVAVIIAIRLSKKK